MVEVTKEFSFDMAHMLDGHDGLCSNVHGHGYRLFVTIRGELIDYGSSDGMVIDFSDLKSLVKKVICDFDHAFVYDTNNSNECEIGEFLSNRGMKVTEFDGRTTCENMSKYFYNEIAAYINTSTIFIEEIVLYETPTSYARYRG
jgi:6-pyruvoyltetrahydropterin/6-carboxytetrahydropterin synthase